VPGGLSIRNAGKVYDPGGLNVVAMEGITFDIPENAFCVVVGPSGCGKTTLLNAIAGFDGVTSGEIYLDGERIAGRAASAKPGPDRMVVFQNGALFPWKTVLWNVSCGPIQQGQLSKSDAERKARDLMAEVGLSGIEGQYPGQLSGGQKRRVEIVRALMNNPKVLLMDEPFRALDALTKSVVQEFLLQVYDSIPKTVFFITHDLEEAIFLADIVVVMSTRPGTVKRVVKTGIPRPRDHNVLTSPQFLRLYGELEALIHEEAMKAFRAGERELA
jgi:NitT/TauT family transport system ATP-binding protein